MSDPATPAPAAADPTSNWDQIAQGISTVVNTIGPLVVAGASLAFPGASVAISAGEKILQGVLSEEPAAVALYKQITSGTPPTAAQVASFETAYEAAYQQTKADIAAAIAKAKN
jgi:hypothetical protein